MRQWSSPKGGVRGDGEESVGERRTQDSCGADDHGRRVGCLMVSDGEITQNSLVGIPL